MSNDKQSSLELFALALYEGGYLQGNGIEIEILLDHCKEREKEEKKEEIAKAFDRGRFWNMSWDGNSYYEEIIIKGNNE
jgi:hypothetical protein